MTHFFIILTPWHWLTLGALLLILELLISGGFLLWLAVAAGVVSGLAWLFPDLTGAHQILIFASVGMVSSLIWWMYLNRHS